MIGLEEAKAIIHGADPDIDPEQYSEIDAEIVIKEGWKHLGEDFYYDKRKNRIAGPSGGSPIRILVELGAAVREKKPGRKRSKYNALDWERVLEDRSGLRTSDLGA